MPRETVLVLASLAAFGVVHSLMAAFGFKAWVARRLGERAYLGFYRLFYNVFSGITFLPILALVALRPGPTIWSAHGLAAVLLAGLQGAALIGLAVSVLQIDGWRFVGLRQAAAYFNGDPLPLPDEPFIERGMYALVRHPLYLGSAVWLWAMPHMNAASLGLALGATLYFIAGALHEECRLVKEIGEPYRRYQERVPFLLPFVRVPTPRC